MNAVVYYPYLTPSLDWLKVSSLCWEKVYVLHPPIVVSFPKDIEMANKVLGSILIPLDIQAIGANKEIIDEFTKWLNINGKRITADKVTDSEEDKVFARLIGAKIPHELLEVLEKENLVFNGHDKRTKGKRYFFWSGFENYWSMTGKRQPDESEFDFRKRQFEEQEYQIYLPSTVALQYFSLCASRVAAMKKADLYGVNSEFSETAISSSSMLMGQIIHNVINAYFPDNLENISFKNLSELREELAQKRLIFQSEIQILSKRFSDVCTEDELAILKNKIEDIAKDRINETQKTFKENKIKLVIKSIGISLTPPALANYIASVLNIGIIEPAGIGISMALFTANTLLEYNKAKVDYENNAWSYVLDIKRQLR